jgi:hypothetical protein
MERRIWTGVVAGVLAAAVLLTVGVGAYRAGQDDEVTRVVDVGRRGGGDEVVRVVGDHHGFGPGPFFFLLPLLLIVLVVLLVRRAGRGWGHGWGPGGWAHGGPGQGGPGGPGYGGWGPGPGGRSDWLDEWHRRAHEESRPGSPTGGTPDATPPGATAPGGETPGGTTAEDGRPAPPPSGG